MVTVTGFPLCVCVLTWANLYVLLTPGNLSSSIQWIRNGIKRKVLLNGIFREVFAIKNTNVHTQKYVERRTYFRHIGILKDRALMMTVVLYVIVLCTLFCSLLFFFYKKYNQTRASDYETEG